MQIIGSRDLAYLKASAQICLQRLCSWKFRPASKENNILITLWRVVYNPFPCLPHDIFLHTMCRSYLDGGNKIKQTMKSCWVHKHLFSIVLNLVRHHHRAAALTLQVYTSGIKDWKHISCVSWVPHGFHTSSQIRICESNCVFVCNAATEGVLAKWVSSFSNEV